jgi:two-component system, chemotaxis family, sensor kinase Cph1
MTMQPRYIPRTQLNEEELKDALDACEREPIHIPNKIQPHGALIVTDRKTSRVVQVSKNIAEFLDIPAEDMIGQKLKDVIGEDQANSLNMITREYELQPLKSTMLDIKGQRYDAVTHYSGNYKILELEITEIAEHNVKEEHVYEGMRDFAIILQQVNDIDALNMTIVSEIRKITKFARVKLYQFDEEWNGMVKAESREEHMPSYLGLNFPASDIPPQARKLYAKNYLRLIVDTRYKPVELYPSMIQGEQKPIDMSFSILRSVSPVHIQYLENINVGASMSISIMQNGKLWGLVACHHDGPLHVPYKMRILAEIIGHIFSAKLSSLEQANVQEIATKKSLLIEKMASQLNTAVKAEDILFGNHEIAMQALNADGFIIHTGNHLHSFGKIPSIDVLEELIKWYTQNTSGKILYTQDTKKFFAGKGVSLAVHGGFLIVPIGRQGRDFAIWLRKEKTEDVQWAGKPEKPLEKTKAGYRLTPRSSFEIWKESAKGKCTPWSEEDIQAAQSIAYIIIESEKIHAEQASAAKTEFLSNMSHELRTPLGAIIGIINILNKDASLNGKQKELINTLNISSSLLLSLINNLLDIAKIEAKVVHVEELSFSLSHLMEDIRSIMKVKADEKGIDLTIDYKKDDHDLLIGDAGKIKQILVNLVNNALKFTDNGFVNVVADLEKREPEKFFITFKIEDSGIGISEKQKETIFQKFSQADSLISRKYEGTGLGLSITKGLVELMGGSIHFDSQEGLGSKFFVEIPLRVDIHDEPNKEQIFTRHPPLMTENTTIPKKVLLVEDYEGNIVVIMYQLQEEGYDVMIAKNGKEAIQMLEKDNFDIVIMDVRMPVMDGLTATRIIKEKQKNGDLPHIPVLGMTANVMKKDRDECLASGMDDYISKPLDFSELFKKISKLI